MARRTAAPVVRAAPYEQRLPWHTMGIERSRGTQVRIWGKAKDAEAVYDEMRARERRQYVPPAALAVAASGAAREDDAVRHTRDAFEIRDPHSQFLISRYFPMSARLYGYPGFREVLAHMGRGDWLRG
jgi:hypothetical protein